MASARSLQVLPPGEAELAEVLEGRRGFDWSWRAWCRGQDDPGRVDQVLGYIHRVEGMDMLKRNPTALVMPLVAYIVWRAWLC